MGKNEKVTIYDISKRLDISAATVSRALNDNPKISDKTRDLVVKTAREMNYKQNLLAKALKEGRSQIVGIMVPYINRNFFSSVIGGIEEKLAPHGYQVIICQSHEDFENEVSKINTLIDTQVDGIFWSISKTTQSVSHIKKALDKDVSLIFFDRKIDWEGTSSIVIDDYEGGFMATEHLIEFGCKRIAHIAGDRHLQIYKYRYEGYRDALKKHDISFSDDLLVETTSDIQAGKDAVELLWQNDQTPDAIFAAGDFTAFGATKELQSRGILIPDEVKVVGFSNEPFSEHASVPISSVDQNPSLMGKMAAEIFLEEQENENEISIQKKVVLSPELIIRKSSDNSLQ